MDKYYRIPLSLLRKGGSALESLELCLSLGIVNAGIGLHKSDIDSYSEVLSMAVESIQKDGLPTRLKNNLVFNDASGVSIGRPQSELLYERGIVGRWLLGIQGAVLTRHLDTVKTTPSIGGPGRFFLQLKKASYGGLSTRPEKTTVKELIAISAQSAGESSASLPQFFRRL